MLLFKLGIKIVIFRGKRVNRYAYGLGKRRATYYVKKGKMPKLNVFLQSSV